jgi:hypothetical protein
MSDSKKVAVRFIKPNLPYLIGETAWFDELTAASLIKQGFAEPDRDAGEFQPLRAPERLTV